MKERQKYRVKKRYGMYRVGDIITPTGMLRHELVKCGRIEKYDESIATEGLAPVIEEAPVPPCDDDDIADDIDEDEDDSPLIETAVAPLASTAEFQPRRGRGRPRRA